jgi:hypothetical protein
MEILEISYCFILDDQRREVFDLQLDARSLELINKGSQDFPFWTDLEYHQCPHCPLNKESVPHCPVATALASVIERFENVFSYDEVDLEVITSQRHVTQHTTAQRALGSFIGLLFATSGCPHTDYFKPMARFHLPLASLEDTMFRVTSMYLMAQYFRHKEGEECEFELTGLAEIFDNMHQLNIMVTERIRSATQTDSSINAVIQLDSILGLMPYISEEKMAEIRHLFAAYLSDSKEVS